MDPEVLENRFTYHPPKGDQAIRYEMIRDAAHRFARFLNERCPDSPELEFAIACIDVAVMQANAAIARNE